MIPIGAVHCRPHLSVAAKPTHTTHTQVMVGTWWHWALGRNWIGLDWIGLPLSDLPGSRLASEAPEFSSTVPKNEVAWISYRASDTSTTARFHGRWPNLG